MKIFGINWLVIFLAAVMGSLFACQSQVNTEENGELRVVDKVYPLIDSSNSRWLFFGSATRPFGMVNLSPDMDLNGAWESGYQFDKDSVKVFSHIHGWQISGIPVLPTNGEFRGHMGPEIYGSPYNHDSEVVEAGYHKITLDAYDITAELTSTKRVGFHRYRFPPSDSSYIHFDFTTILGPSGTQSGYIERVSDTELQGYAVMEPTIRRPKPFTVYFVADFDQPFETFGGWKDGELVAVDNTIEGENTGGYIQFSTRDNTERLMKVAISYVSIEQARLNLDTELPHWDFDQVVQDSKNEWNEALTRIEVEGGTEEEQSRFYTDLWKALQGRRTVSDVNGKYIDMTGDEPRVGQIPLNSSGEPLFNHYNSDSFWGSQWNLNILWHLAYPEISEEFVNSMLLMYDDGGLIPRGPSGGNYTFVMTGASFTPFIASAYAKGIKNFDVEKAYEGMKKNHMPGGIMAKAGYEHDTFCGGGLEEYIERGYIPFPLNEEPCGFHEDGAGQTLEYAYQDWALSEMAAVLGYSEDHNYFSERAQNYKNLWHADSTWMWVRNRNGEWKEPFDILEYGEGWVETNAAQSTWWVPHDVQGLINLMDGSENFTSKLNKAFERAQNHNFTSGSAHAQETLRELRRVYVNYGNQQTQQMAWLFNYSGSPWLTQKWAREVTNKVYRGLSPETGYNGDEDQGQMGALAVLFKTGLFSVNGGAASNPVYEIGSPIFDKITFHLHSDYYEGDTFVIEARNNSAQNRYIQSATIDGEPLSKPWFYHSELADGGILILEMGSEPNKEWGSDPDDAPPSMSEPEN